MAPEIPDPLPLGRVPVGGYPEVAILEDALSEIPERPAIKQQAVRSFAWAAASLGSNRVVVFVSTLVLARLLSPADFGVVAAGLTVISFLEVGLSLGVSSAIIYEQEEGFTPRVHTAFILNVAVAALLTIIMLVSAPLIARFFHVGGDVNIFRALSLYLLIHGVGQTNDALLQRDLLFKKRALADVIKSITRASVSLGLAVAGAGAWAIVAGFLAAEVADVVSQWIMVRYRPRAVFLRSAVPSLLKFGVSVVALDALGEVGINSDYLAVGNTLGPTELGFYTVAFRLPELMLNSIYWIFSTVAFPVFSKSRTYGDETLKTTMLRALTLATLIGFPIGVGLSVVSRDAVMVLFGSKWGHSISAMTVLCLASGVSSIGYASGDIFKSIGRPWTLLAINAPATTLVAVGFFVAAPHGIFAVACVHLAYNSVYATARLLVANHYLHSRMSEVLRAMVPATSAAAGIALFAIPVRVVMSPGATSLIATLTAGLIGGAVGIALGGRSAVAELRDLARTLVGKADAPDRRSGPEASR
jgi:lipopolysaccharide exporter